MGEKSTKRYLFWGMVLHPVALLVYGVMCFYLYSLFQYGGVRRRIPIIVSCMTLLLLWFFWCVYTKRKRKFYAPYKDDSSLEKVLTRRKIGLYFGCVAFIVITATTGMKMYHSSQNYTGKLSWFINDLKNKRQVEYKDDNIYDDNLEGIFNAIKSKIKMPEELYVSSDFKLDFQKDGKILSFDTYVYGKNEEGKTESFLITYDDTKSEKITVYLKGYVNATYDEAKRLKPLLDMVKVIPLQETIYKWNKEQYALLYLGVRSWGYNTDGIVYVDREGNMREAKHPMEEIIGFTLSVYETGNQALTPLRFIADWERAELNPDKEEEKNTETGYIKIEGEEAFFLDKDHGYMLKVLDAALGSRFYGLAETTDGGSTWETINQDPFLEKTGVSAGITFIDNNLGFIGLSHSGGSYGELYRTQDGGLTYEEVSIPPYNPFDLPGMPYEEDGKLVLPVGQGQDGDYNGGSKALYQSKDKGISWEYIREL